MRLRLLTVLFVASACGAPPVGAPHPTPRTTAAEPAPEPSPPRDDGRLPATVRPTRYFLELNVDPKEKTFAGRVRIGIDVLTPTAEVVLHAKGPKILTAAVSTPRDKLWARSTVRKAAHGKQEAEELVLSFSRPLEPGPAEIDLQYEAPFAPELGGLYRVESRGQAFAFTQFEPNDARRAFPCFDEPGFKVPFRISVTVPEGNLVVANTRELRRRETPSTGLVSYEFEPTAPLPTYLVAVAVGPFELLEGPRSPVPIRVVTVPGKSRLGKLALATAEETLGALADYFGIAYPYSKLDLVAVPEFSAGAMENAGLVTFREERVLLDEDKASLESRRGLLELMAHELAHQWFGNLVTMKWWDDIWLNEGFANWMGDHVVERARPAWGIGAERVQAKDWVMRLDMLDSARRVRQRVRGSSEALEAFDGITYVKGASAITQLESYLGPATFQRGIRDYVRAHAHKNASSSDLTDALARASGKDVAGVLGSFVDQTGVPLVEATTRCAKGHLDVKLSQREYRPFGRAPRERRWSIPVCLGAPELDGGELCTLLREPTATLERDVPRCPRRIFPNAGERGYYRYRLGETELLALARDASLTRAERVGLIGAWALVRAGISRSSATSKR
ncbi:MAG: M1 family aminopeptidase [Polyangiaceae bacterium]